MNVGNYVIKNGQVKNSLSCDEFEKKNLMEKEIFSCRVHKQNGA